MHNITWLPSEIGISGAVCTENVIPLCLSGMIFKLIKSKTSPFPSQ